MHIRLVCLTKYRRGTFKDDMLTACERIMCDVCGDSGFEPGEFTGEEDDVYLLVRHPPTIALSRLGNSIKGVSLRHLRADYADRINRARSMQATLGHRSTSAHSSAERPCPSSRSTSVARSDRTSAVVGERAIPLSAEAPNCLGATR
ncbi:hypothetical protein GCM10027456_23580 [Kineosporia babensis]